MGVDIYRYVKITFDPGVPAGQFDSFFRECLEKAAGLRGQGMTVSTGLYHEIDLRWSDLDDLDKGAVLMHLHKREWEGADYAAENYPCVFVTDPRLKALSNAEANEFAVSLEDVVDELGGEESARLWQLFQDHERG